MKWVAFSSVFAGIAGYIVIFFATSSLGADRFEVFNVYWGLFFTIQGVIQGLMHETTRAVRAVALASEGETAAPGGLADAPPRAAGAVVGESGAHAAAAATGPVATVTADDPTAEDLLVEEPSREDTEIPASQRAHPLRLSVVLGLIAAGVVLASSPLWAPVLLPEGERALGVALLTVASALAAVQCAFCGALSGSQNWGRFAMVVSGEAAVRVAISGACVVLGASVAGFLYATVAGVVMTPLMLLVSRRSRAMLHVRADVGTRAFVFRTLQAMLAASAAAVLVVGFPVLIKATLPGTDPVVISNLLLAVTLTRAPILMPITSFQNAIVVYFVDRTAKGRSVVLLPVAIVLGVAAIGAALAYLVGEPIIHLMGPGFAVGGPVLAALTFAAGFTGGLFITGAAVLARERHGLYVAGWWTASASAVLFLLFADGAAEATVLALSVGPAVGMLVHVVFGMRARQAGTAAPPEIEPTVAGEPVDTA